MPLILLIIIKKILSGPPLLVSSQTFIRWDTWSACQNQNKIDNKKCNFWFIDGSQAALIVFDFENSALSSPIKTLNCIKSLKIFLKDAIYGQFMKGKLVRGKSVKISEGLFHSFRVKNALHYEYMFFSKHTEWNRSSKFFWSCMQRKSI